MKREKEVSEKNVAKRKSSKKTIVMPTLIDAIEKVVELAEDSKLSSEAMLNMSPWTGFLADKYGITERQVVLFSICIDRGPFRVDFDDLARYLNLSNIRILSYSSDIDALVRCRLLRYRDVKEENCFDVNPMVMKALRHNEVYEKPQRTGLDCASLFEYLNELFDDLDNDAITEQNLGHEIGQLFDDNPQLNFVKQVKSLNLQSTNLLLLMLFCHLLINEDDDDVRFGQMEKVFRCTSDFNRAKGELRTGEHLLFRRNLIEHNNANGIVDTTRYRLTKEAKRGLLAEMKLSEVEEKIGGVMDHKSLTPKAMFYPQAIGKQVDELTKYFTQDEYEQIRQRMQQRGFRQGFACLFYGGPGTGKTETVYQLARQTGRDIMVVDVPQIKSKWVGDSEKNVKALFDQYREMVKRCDVAPILLFNEADAIIGVRKTGATNAVDKMENTLQNIILQEMETLEGIMIATTNLEENLDSAFERRFLYKIRFEKPDAGVRSKIWKVMVPEINEGDAAVLAADYEFSGGQIENIARKYAIHAVLNGEPDDVLSKLQEYCQCEKLEHSTSKRRVGF